MKGAARSAVAVTSKPNLLELTRHPGHWKAQFTAMSCPCEVLIDDVPERAARLISESVAACAWRVEAKFSRYLPNNIVHRINNSEGRVVEVDKEVADLLDFASVLTRLSEGRFDITSGVLRRIWTFDGTDHVPTQGEIDQVLELVGWHKVSWQRPRLQMQQGMQIDFGGIGKEYAVDAAVQRAHEIAHGVSCLVNFGGDVAVRNPRRDGIPWRVGVESSDTPGECRALLALHTGAIATSGDSRRYLLKDGKRYSHVLDARTGWAISDAPHSITVRAASCTQAGSFTTLAMLQGQQAEAFLQKQGVHYWLR